MERVVYICSPYAADSKKKRKENKEYAKELTFKVLANGDSPITPHLYITKCLDDDIPTQRKLGMDAGKNLILRCDFVLVGTRLGISRGMTEEIEFAHENGIDVTEIDY